MLPMQVHPATVQKHAGQQRCIGGNRDDLGWERRVSEHDGGNRAILKHEAFFRAGRQGALVDKYHAHRYR